jgi:uncharacterized membrane protein
MNNRTKLLLAASLATAISAPMIATADSHGAAQKSDKSGEKVHCYGVNKCKGVGDCGGQGTSCKGTNACSRQGFLEMDKETCLKLDGGSLTPPAAKK